LKFISVMGYYSQNVANMLEKQNYHLLPLKVAKDAGLQPELWLLEPDHPDMAESFPEWLVVRMFKSRLKYVWALLRNDNSIIYANARLVRTMIAAFFGRKTIFIGHQNEMPKKKWQRLGLGFLMKHFDICRATTPGDKENMMAMGVKEENIRMIPLSIDIDFWKEGSDEKEFDVISTVNIREQKNADVIKAACKKAGASVVFVGKNFTSLDIETTGRVSVEKVRDYLHKSKVFVNSSTTEGMCLAVYEAAAAQLPLCLPNLLTFAHFNAKFHDPRDVDQLAENIQAQLKLPICESYDLNITYESVCEELKKIIGDFKECQR